MKTILAFIGSSRNLGNSEIMVKEISRNLEVNHDLRMIRLPAFDIHPCRGCYACLFGEKGCVIKDDFNGLIDEILAADAYIAAAPTYFLGPSSVFKRLSDRGLALYNHAEALWGKPAVAVGIAGIEDREGYTQLGMESFFKLLLADLKASRIVYGALPGEIFYNDANKAAAAELASALFDEPPAEVGPACPVCGGRTFRFFDDNRVRCMLCSNPGTVSTTGEQIRFNVEKGEHEMFTSLEAAVTHRAWLKRMKDRFLAEKENLKPITLSYRKEGTWVKPPRSVDKA